MRGGGERDALAYLAALTGPAQTGWIELRLRQCGQRGMRPRFFRVADLRLAARLGLVRACEDDVYIGVAVRRRKAGGKAALGNGSTIWVDCDDRASIDALESFDPQPGVVVQTSADGRHALWPLRHEMPVAEIERANRRVAHHLGACQSSVTNAAAVLRLPGTLNHKYDPAPPVELVQFTGERVDIDDIVGGLADPPDIHAATGAAVRWRVDDQAAEPLAAIPPRVYFERLAGLVAARDGKVHCPFHEDRTPSCHLYETAGAGWYCYGCGTGGDVYSFGALCLGIAPRGATFVDLRRELYARLLPGVPVPAWRRSRTRHEASRRSRRIVLMPVSGSRR